VVKTRVQTAFKSKALKQLLVYVSSLKSSTVLDMAAPNSTPTDEVLTMRQQGMSNNQISEALQREGYALNRILEAMNQADVKSQIEPFKLKKGDMMPENQMQPTAPPMPGGQYDQGAYGGDMGGGYNDDGDLRGKIEELAEAIIDEKWETLIANVNRIIEWKEKTEAKVAEFETRIKSMKDDFDKLHSALLEKVGEYDSHIQDVGTEVKALEKVFQKVLPGFMENVAELSRITSKMKGGTLK
jgi:hypothetical protein